MRILSFFSHPWKFQKAFFFDHEPQFGIQSKQSASLLTLHAECTPLISRVHAQRMVKLLASSYFRVVGSFNNELLLLSDIKMLHV